MRRCFGADCFRVCKEGHRESNSYVHPEFPEKTNTSIFPLCPYTVQSQLHSFQILPISTTSSSNGLDIFIYKHNSIGMDIRHLACMFSIK